MVESGGVERPRPDRMRMSKVGNQTNSQDPQAVNSRVFVGNLNTFQCSKTDVERIFQRYGRLAGISMHKGYAFVQFTSPLDARSACLGEDGRTVLSQVLDVNMVAEPKAHQTGRKRQNVNRTGNDWDYYYDSYYTSATAPGVARSAPPCKRPRLVAPTDRNGQSESTESTPGAIHIGDLKKYSSPDILICGNCRELFSEVEELLEHKRAYCKLRFTCKCRPPNVFLDANKGTKTAKEEEEVGAAAQLVCVQCKNAYDSAWDLLVHAQAAHMLNVYELGVPAAAAAPCTVLPLSPRPSTPDKDGCPNSRQSSLNGASE